MLSDLNDLQESDEDIWSTPNLSFEIETRADDGRELVQRRYVFNYAKEWDKWTFSEFLERRTDDMDMSTGRNWRRSRHVSWSDSEAPDVEVPPEVTEKLEEVLGLEKIVLQKP